MSYLLNVFFKSKEANPWLVLALLLLAGLFEGLGISTMLPVLALVSETGEATSPLFRMVTEGLAMVGLTPTLRTLLLIGVTGIFAKAVFSIIAMSYVGYAGAAVATRLRTQIIKHILTVRWSYFTDLALGRVANYMSVDTTRSTSAYISVAIMLKGVIETVVYLTIAALVSWKLALAALAIGGAIALSLQFLVIMVRIGGRQQTRRTMQLVTYFNDILNNIKPLKAMAAQDLSAALIRKRIIQVNNALRKQVVGQHALRHSEEFLVVLCLAGGFYAAYTVWAIPISEFLVIGILLFTSINSVGRIQRNYQKAVMQEEPIKNVEAFIEEVSAAREANPGTKVPTFATGCRFEGVAFSHPTKPILNDVSLEIPAGSFTVITGPSGTGKTTLTDLILGLYRPASGDILIDGVSLQEIDLEKWRRMVGYVPQEFILLHDTIFANVTLGDPDIDEPAARAALQAAGAWDFVAAQPDGLQSPVGDKGTKLSGGQRQRIALARALVRQPKLLILDEVTSALDPATERDICENIKAIKGNLTVLTISHREAWTNLADRIYRLEDGKIELTESANAIERRALPS